MTARFNVSDEWKRWLVGVGMAGMVAYFTTVQTIRGEVADVKTYVAAVKATQESQFQEVLRRLDTMQEDIRELRPAR